MDYQTAKTLKDAGFISPPIEEFVYNRKKHPRGTAAWNVVCECNGPCQKPETCEDIEYPSIEDMIRYIYGEDGVIRCERELVEEVLEKIKAK